MKEILVDTNVLVSFLTDRDKDQQERAAELFLAAREREHSLILHSISISEAIYVLRNLYKVDPQEIAGFDPSIAGVAWGYFCGGSLSGRWSSSAGPA